MSFPLRRGVGAAVVTLAAVSVGSALPGRAHAEQARATGPLRVLAANPRYFADGAGRPVYLTGSHVWWNLLGSTTWKSDCRNGGSAQPFSYQDYLDRLTRHNHNFIRLWTIELTRWEECGETVVVGPQPWRRTGPGTALDGLPRFDLRRPNPAYFRRLRSRVAAAGERGIYVSVMLFEGWGVRNLRGWRWRSHPFNRRNNVNGVDGDANRDGTGAEVHTLAVPRVTALQSAYVRRVVNAVYDLDNVLFEISNESGVESTAWQYRMIELVRRVEAATGRRLHPVGMTFQHPHGRHSALLRSSAEWISPFGLRYISNPPPARGLKVSLSDTDHHCGLCGDATFPWRNFLRGHNPIYMDDFQENAHKEAVRTAMGQTRRYAERIDLARVRPRGDVASTAYCLADAGREYLVYQPRKTAFTVDLRAAPGRFSVEWFDPDLDAVSAGSPVQGGEIVTFDAPFPRQAVLYLRRLPGHEGGR
jgi:hypothetical protein